MKLSMSAADFRLSTRTHITLGKNISLDDNFALNMCTCLVEDKSDTMKSVLVPLPPTNKDDLYLLHQGCYEALDFWVLHQTLADNLLSRIPKWQPCYAGFLTFYFRSTSSASFMTLGFLRNAAKSITKMMLHQPSKGIETIFKVKLANSTRIF